VSSASAALLQRRKLERRAASGSFEVNEDSEEKKESSPQDVNDLSALELRKLINTIAGDISTVADKLKFYCPLEGFKAMADEIKLAYSFDKLEKLEKPHLIVAWNSIYFRICRMITHFYSEYKDIDNHLTRSEIMKLTGKLNDNKYFQTLFGKQLNDILNSFNDGDFKGHLEKIIQAFSTIQQSCDFCLKSDAFKNKKLIPSVKSRPLLGCIDESILHEEPIVLCELFNSSFSIYQSDIVKLIKERCLSPDLKLKNGARGEFTPISTKLKRCNVSVFQSKESPLEKMKGFGILSKIGQFDESTTTPARLMDQDYYVRHVKNATAVFHVIACDANSVHRVSEVSNILEGAFLAQNVPYHQTDTYLLVLVDATWADQDLLLPNLKNIYSAFSRLNGTDGPYRGCYFMCTRKEYGLGVVGLVNNFEYKDPFSIKDGNAVISEDAITNQYRLQGLKYSFINNHSLFFEEKFDTARSLPGPALSRAVRRSRQSAEFAVDYALPATTFTGLTLVSYEALFAGKFALWASICMLTSSTALLLLGIHREKIQGILVNATGKTAQAFNGLIYGYPPPTELKNTKEFATNLDQLKDGQIYSIFG
jgi:hypothetical protein